MKNGKIAFKQKAVRNPNQEVTLNGAIVLLVAFGWATIFLDQLIANVGSELDLDLAFQSLVRQITPGNLNNCACFAVEGNITREEREWFLSLAQRTYVEHCKTSLV